MKTNLLFFVSISLLLLVSNAVGAESRTWTAKSGHEITGELITVNDGTVQIALADGKTVKVKIEQLSDNDQNFIKSQNKKQNANPFEVIDHPVSSEKNNSVQFDWKTPLDILKTEAEKDNPDAILELALRYMEGRDGCQTDHSKASGLFQKGAKHADKNSPAGQTCKGLFYWQVSWNEPSVTKNKNEAIRLLQKEAEQGFAVAQFALGLYYRYLDSDEDTEKEETKEAFKWFRKAAEQGHVGAQCNLARCYLNGWGVDEDYAKTFEWFRKAAEQGYAQAQFDVGYCFKEGWGVAKNDIESVKWYRKAAEQGNSEAQKYLGNCYAKGIGVDKDDAEAFKWFRKNYEQSPSDSVAITIGDCYVNGGNGINKDYEEAIKWYRQAADKGDVEAQYKIGICYSTGGFGIHKNYTEAIKRFRNTTAKQGLMLTTTYPYRIGSLYELGICYSNGIGVTKDITEAAKLFRKMIELEKERSQFSVKEFAYRNDSNVHKDYRKVTQWLRKAADQGNADAQYGYGWCLANGNGTSHDKQAAVESFRQAAKQGDVIAVVEIGDCYSTGGFGILQNCAEAVKWYREAANKGNAEAEYKLGICYLNGNGVDKDIT
ncbi:MAG: sel1 repeat family protein, partial [Planctomycetaceae bacterium]|nr:sel1 repeat family protein [Planctomycetaceae bacterium]